MYQARRLNSLRKENRVHSLLWADSSHEHHSLFVGTERGQIFLATISLQGRGEEKLVHLWTAPENEAITGIFLEKVKVVQTRMEGGGQIICWL